MFGAYYFGQTHPGAAPPLQAGASGGGGAFGSCYFAESYFGQGCGAGGIEVAPEPEPEVPEEQRLGGFFILPVSADRRGTNVYPDDILLVSSFGNAHIEIPVSAVPGSVRFRIKSGDCDAGGGALIRIRNSGRNTTMRICGARIKGIKNPTEREMAVITQDYW